MRGSESAKGSVGNHVCSRRLKVHGSVAKKKRIIVSFSSLGVKSHLGVPGTNICLYIFSLLFTYIFISLYSIYIYSSKHVQYLTRARTDRANRLIPLLLLLQLNPSKSWPSDPLLLFGNFCFAATAATGSFTCSFSAMAAGQE